MNDCDALRDLLTDLLPNLPPGGLEWVDHLHTCADCRDDLDARLDVAQSLLEHGGPPPSLPDDFADRVLSALPPTQPVPAHTPSGLRWVAAAAIGFAVGLGVAPRAHPPAAPPIQEAAAPAERSAPEEPAPVAPVAPAPEQPPELGPDLRPYLTEAGLVLEALEQADPEQFEVLASYIRQAQLLDEGERILVAIQARPGTQGEWVPLIHGTQVVLRKVRNAGSQARGAQVLRATVAREVRETGLLEAYRALHVETPPPQVTSPEVAVRGPL